MTEILFCVFGIISGVVGGMGMGGGTVLIPLLTIFLGVAQKVAQGYNLLGFLAMAIVALVLHIKNKMIDVKGVFVMVLFGMASCVGGAFLTKVVEVEVLKIGFAVFLIGLSIWQFVLAVKEKN